MTILHQLRESKREGKKMLAVLIDPDKAGNEDLLKQSITQFENWGVDLFLVGGSLLTTVRMADIGKIIKTYASKPVVIFPGSPLHIQSNADGILLLSLISGRNPDLLIGKHVEAAPFLKMSGLEILPTGYLLIGDSQQTTAAYISQTNPIPYGKAEIAACTAMAGELLGLKLIYLDAGSGSEKEVPPSMINEVKKSVEIPVIVGGGINTADKAIAAWKAGADVIVLGTVVEKDQGFIEVLAKARELELH